MGEAKRKAALPAMISVLIPERGRPAQLERCIASLLDTAGDDPCIEILVAVDDDDPAWLGRPAPELDRTRFFRDARPSTLGYKLQLMSREARGDILWFFANDMVMDTPGWPDAFRGAVRALPLGIGVPFPRDALHPDHASYPVISRRTMEAVGFFMPPPYPYWFIDTHWDCLGIMMGQHNEISVVTVSAPEGRGRTHGLVDLDFWTEFFHALEPVRVHEATKLIQAAYPAGTQALTNAMRDLPLRRQVCLNRTQHLRSPEFLAQWGDTAESDPSPAYRQVKADAVRMLESLRATQPDRPRVAICVPSGREWCGMMGNSLAALTSYTASHGPVDVALLNVQTSLISQGRNRSVEIALQQNCDYVFFIDSDMRFPPDALVRLLRHDKDIVGALYNKRVPRPDGTYETLGKLKGSKPPGRLEGLHEATQLPGGMVLIKAEVFRKLPKPWYAECYRWDGATDLEAFRNLLRFYFGPTPPDAVLDGLAETDLGRWIEGNYSFGESGEKFEMWSEDLFFCRSAIKCGFTLWADVSLTYEVAHLGEIPVTCLPAPEVAAGPMLAAAE